MRYLKLALTAIFFVVIHQTHAQRLFEAEYFFDTDPGVGNGTSISISPTNFLDQNFSIPVNTLSYGGHTFYLRVKDSTGQWSIYLNQSISVTKQQGTNLVSGEYFFDTDPGVGNGTAFSINPAADSIDANLNIDISALSTGQHYLYARVQDSVGQWSVYLRDTFDIIVCNAPTIASVSASQAAICIGDSDTLNVSGSLGSATNWQWYEGGPTGTPLDTASTFIVNPLTTTTYYVRGEGGCVTGAAFDSITVTVNPLPIVNAGTNQTVCEGTQVSLIATGANSYSWSGGIVNGTPFTPALGTNTYVVTGTDVNTCVNSDTVDVTVNTNPLVDAGIDQTVCDGTQITLSATGPNISWSGGITNNVPFTQAVGTQSYIATGTDANTCSNSDTVTVTVNALPTVSAGPDQTVCEGISVTLTGSGASTYVWTGGIIDGSPFNPPVGVNAYVVTGTDANNCSNSDTVQVTVDPAPIVNAGADLTLCEGDTVTLSGSGAQSYAWSGGISDGVAFTPSVGQTSYVVTGTAGNGCTARDTVLVTVNPSYNVNANTSICDGDTLTFGSQILTAAGTYTEIFQTIQNCDSTVNLTLTVNPRFTASASADICDGDSYIFGSQTLTSAGSYTEVFQTSQGCDSTVNLTLSVITVDTSVTVSSNTLTANSAGASYQWLDCDNGNSPISGETNQSFTATQTGNYAVVVTENGCSDTSSCFNIVIIGLRNGISSNIILYPNPTQDRLFVNFPENLEILRIRVVSLTGVEMVLADPSELKEGINTESLKAGMYHLVLEGADFRQELRFVKE